MRKVSPAAGSGRPDEDWPSASAHTAAGAPNRGSARQSTRAPGQRMGKRIGCRVTPVKMWRRRPPRYVAPTRAGKAALALARLEALLLLVDYINAALALH